MKKIYMLVALAAATSLSFAQNIVQNGGLEQWNGNVPAAWTFEEGAVPTKESSVVSQGSYAANFLVSTKDQGKTDFRQPVAVEAGKVYEVSVDIYQVDNTSKARLYVGGYQGYSDPTLVNQWQTLTYEYTAAETKDEEVGVRFYDIDGFDESTGSHVIVDNFVVKAKGSAEVMEVATIAELRNGEEGKAYTFTGEAIVTMTQAFRNQIYIQDATGAILLDDPSDVVTQNYVIGDKVTGLKGVVSTHNNIKQLKPLENGPAAVSSNNPMPVQTVSVGELTDNLQAYQSELVTVANLSTTATGVWEKGTNYDFTNQEGAQLLVRTQFYDADYIGDNLPTEAVNLTGIVSEYNGTVQLFPRMKTDIEVLSVTNINHSKEVKVFVQNGELHALNFVVKNIEVYNVSGQLVAKSTKLASLNKGVYVAVLTNEKGEKVSVKFVK